MVSLSRAAGHDDGGVGVEEAVAIEVVERRRSNAYRVEVRRPADDGVVDGRRDRAGMIGRTLLEDVTDDIRVGVTAERSDDERGNTGDVRRGHGCSLDPLVV